MARRSHPRNSETLRRELIKLLQEFEKKLGDDDLREQVQDLVPANYLLRDLGSSLIVGEGTNSASDRIIAYLSKYPDTLVQGDELMVVAGISEYARRIRELRVQQGWPILSGKAFTEILEDDERLGSRKSYNAISNDMYILLEAKQDRDAAYRWNAANQIRKSNLSVKEKILSYMRKNVGQHVTGEEIKYLAKDKSEWARRVRELRTEEGWPISTRISGLPELPVGVYVLEEDKQAEVHDRKIPDPLRVAVLERDKYSCRKCSWNYDRRNPSDKHRTLIELHHIEHHADGGKNTKKNLISLCNICHDDVHRGNIHAEELLTLIQCG